VKSLALVLTLIFSGSVQAQNFTGVLFEQKSNFSKKLFDLQGSLEIKDGLARTVAVYKDLQRKPVIEEKGVFKGEDLLSFEVDQFQTHEKGRVEVQGEKVFFTYEKDGTKKTAEEKLKKPFLTSANFNVFIANHWKELMSGNEINVRYGVWFRLESVGFKIFKVGEVQNGTQKLIQLRMKPSSLVIAALVDPLNFLYSEDGSQLLELSGRVPPKIQKGSDYKDLDADVRYTSSK